MRGGRPRKAFAIATRNQDRTLPPLRHTIVNGI
jgi:hypothetical protein